MKILIIDDSQICTRSLRRILENLGYVHLAVLHDPQDAVVMLGHYKPDIVFLDLEMPVITGEQLMKDMLLADPKIQVIVHSGIDDSGRLVSCLDKGAVDFILKPPREQDVKDAIETIAASLYNADHGHSD